MTSADHRRLDNFLNPIKEIASVTKNGGYGFDVISINLTCNENKQRCIHVTMRIDGGPFSGFEEAIESFIEELESFHNTLSIFELKQDILIRSLINRLKEIKVAPYDYKKAEKERLEEVHRFGHRTTRF